LYNAIVKQFKKNLESIQISYYSNKNFYDYATIMFDVVYDELFNPYPSDIVMKNKKNLTLRNLNHFWNCICKKM